MLAQPCLHRSPRFCWGLLLSLITGMGIHFSDVQPALAQQCHWVCPHGQNDACFWVCPSPDPACPNCFKRIYKLSDDYQLVVTYDEKVKTDPGLLRDAVVNVEQDSFFSGSPLIFRKDGEVKMAVMLQAIDHPDSNGK